MLLLSLGAVTVAMALPLGDGAASPPPGSGAARTPPKESTAGADTDLYSVKINTLEGKPANLGDYRGKVLLIVNVASKCGYTPQYAKLERVHQKFKDKGLVIIGVPSNDFGGQEPGTSQEIRDFCTRNYAVTFPLMEKSQTKTGDGQSPIYRVLSARTQKLPSWNFCKYLVTRDGKEITFHESAADPESTEFMARIEAALAAPAPAAK